MSKYTIKPVTRKKKPGYVVVCDGREINDGWLYTKEGAEKMIEILRAMWG